MLKWLLLRSPRRERRGGWSGAQHRSCVFIKAKYTKIEPALFCGVWDSNMLSWFTIIGVLKENLVLGGRIVYLLQKSIRYTRFNQILLVFVVDSA